jgi:Fur family transcriptional regulator, ferric uptake regulator
MGRARASEQGESEALRDELRGAGLRATPSRVMVLRLLRGSGSPVSHSEVSETLDGSGWDRATLYRNLLDLTRAGLARRTDVGDHVWRFEAVTSKGHRNEEHPHFVCNQCGTIECLDGLTGVSGPGRRAPKALRRNAVEIQLKGLCDRCF